MTAPPDAEGPLHRAVAMLRLLATGGSRGMALTDLARATGLAPSTVHRLLAQLVDERLAMQIEGSRRYAIGPLAYELGLAAAQQFDVRSLLRPVMEQLARRAEETVYLILRSGDEAVCIDVVEGPTAVRVVTLQVGSRRPLGLGAGGLAILAALPQDEQDRVLGRVARSIETQWGFPAAMLAGSLQATRDTGVATIRNRVNPGVTALGIPFLDSLGQVLGAVTIAATNARMADGRLQQMQRLLQTASVDIRGVLRGTQWARYVD